MISLLIALLPSLVNAEIIANHKYSELRLGYGVDSVTDEIYQNCVTYDRYKFTAEDQFRDYDRHDEVPPRSLDLNVELIKTYHQVDKYTNTSISADVRYAFYSGGFNYDRESRFSLESDRAMVGIEAIANYGRWYLRDVALKPKYEKMLREDPERFYKECGREYVSGFVAGQGIRILFATEKLATYSYEHISASMEASYNAGITSANLKASFLDIAAELSKLGSLSVRLQAYGAGPYSELNQLIRGDADIQKFRNNVSRLVSSMSGGRAVKTAWITQPYPTLVENENRILSEQKRRTLYNLFQMYRKVANSRDRLASVVKNGISHHLEPFCSRYNDDCQKYIKLMNQRFNNLKDAIQKIEDLYRNCVAAKVTSDCILPDIQTVNTDFLTELTWPERYRYILYQRYLEEIRND